MRPLINADKSGMNGGRPAAWSLHAYKSSHRPEAEGRDKVRGYLNAINQGSSRPKLWLTEQGGRYDIRPNPAPLRDHCNLMRFREFDDRIARYYQYLLVGPRRGNPTDDFDSALVGVDSMGREVERKQYDVYRYYSAATGNGNTAC